MNSNYNWDATAFFERLCGCNRLCQAEGFVFCRVSGLQGFEEALDNMQIALVFVCVSDTSQGYTRQTKEALTRA